MAAKQMSASPHCHYLRHFRLLAIRTARQALPVQLDPPL
jgi:hypothetical protein